MTHKDHSAVCHANESKDTEHADELDGVLVELEAHGLGKQDGSHQLTLSSGKTWVRENEKLVITKFKLAKQ